MTINEIKQQLENVRYEEWNEIAAFYSNDTRAGVQALLRKKRKQFESEQALRDDFRRRLFYEAELMSQGYHRIAGIDEVGRGPLAGPVVAAAVILPEGFYFPGLDDSKKMSKQARAKAFNAIIDQATVGVGIVEAEAIDQVNIYEATKLAMTEAVRRLDAVDALLIDAMRLDIELPQTSLIKGDTLSVSIAAASVVAKVTRDKMMEDYAVVYPGYGFDRNAGYGTKEHLSGLDQQGITPIHRKSFAPIKNM